MLHFSPLAVRGTLLFRQAPEAAALWDSLVPSVRLHALVLMPDHAHIVVAGPDQVPALMTALRNYARWRNRSRGEAGPVFEHGIAPTPVHDGSHLDRMRRYVHLNPCRAGLVDDPLAWPFSTHRDALGLAVPAAFRAERDPGRFHAYVSADPAVNVTGTTLPSPRAASPGSATLDEVRAAVSSLTRTSDARLGRRGRARDLFIRAAAALTSATSARIAEMVGISPSRVRHVAAEPDAAVQLVERVLGDPRFALIPDHDLRREPSWARYRHKR